MKPLKIALITVCALVIAAIAFGFSGFYNVSARVPHLSLTALLLEAARDRSIARYSSKVAPPASEDPEAAMVGAVHFDATCRKCHGAPGKPQEEFAEGLYPKPPSLTESAKELDRKEIFWVIDNGLKMTGMPAFGVNHEQKEIIGMTDFIKKLPEFDEHGYAQFVKEAMAQGLDEDHHHGDSASDMPPEKPHGHSDETEGHHH
jgi:mono/diheme cytochrome c family protein